MRKDKDKGKIIESHNYMIIEDTGHLSNEQMITFLTEVLEKESTKSFSRVSVLVDKSFSSSVDQFLMEHGFQLREETVTVYRDLILLPESRETFRWKTLEDVPQETFLEMWASCMEGSLNAPSASSMEDQLLSVKKELGAGYKKSCVIAYEEGSPLGIMIPHIEPDTTEEGRIFYLGLLPNERGKGMSKHLHHQAFVFLRHECQASYYIGSTSNKNLPMQRTFRQNGCSILEENKVYQRETSH